MFKVLIIAAKHEHAFTWATLQGVTREQYDNCCRYVYNESNLIGYCGPTVAVIRLNDGGYNKLSADAWHRIAILKYDGAKMFHVDAETPSEEFIAWKTKMMTITSI